MEIWYKLSSSPWSEKDDMRMDKEVKTQNETFYEAFSVAVLIVPKKQSSTVLFFLGGGGGFQICSVPSSLTMITSPPHLSQLTTKP